MPDFTKLIIAKFAEHTTLELKYTRSTYEEVLDNPKYADFSTTAGAREGLRTALALCNAELARRVS
jgi:hypothetical protein